MSDVNIIREINYKYYFYKRYMQFLTHIIFLLNLLKTLINHFS